jgi:hypothetical protein
MQRSSSPVHLSTPTCAVCQNGGRELFPTSVNLVGPDLTNANFSFAYLTDADLTSAHIRGANFHYDAGYFNPWGRWGWGWGWYPPRGSGITLSQLYSTASYQERDLRGVTRIDLLNATTLDIILPSGHIDGLDLGVGELMVVRDYDGNPRSFIAPIPITVDRNLSIDPGGTLRIVFDEDDWNSTISLAPGIPVTLGGTLELIFAGDVNVANQMGVTRTPLCRIFTV